MLLVAAAAWAGALIGGGLGAVRAAAVVLVAVVAAAVVVRVVARVRGHDVGRRRELTRTVAAAGLVLAALASTAAVRETQVGADPVAALADQRAAVRVSGVVATDVRVLEGRFGEQRMVRLAVREVTGRGSTWRTRAPVLVIADPDELPGARLGARLELAGRLAPSDGDDLAGVLSPSGPARVLAAPGPVWRGAERVRAAVRDAVAHRPAEQAALVPALVDGDDAGVSESLSADFQVAGLTHLLAVSGTNLTLLVGFLLVLARWGGVRGHWLVVVAAFGIAGFVVLARTEPSVLRAAVMGTVGLLAMSGNGRQRGPRALAVAVTVLLLVQPGLAPMPGFALSVLATAGIVLVAPAWRDALARWSPRWLAEAVAVSAAAQLACTPVVAAISGQVSLVAVAANLLVAPVVGPATVLGLAGGLVGLLWGWAGRLLGTGAGWCVGWVIAVARRAADLPTAAVGWGTTPAALAGLTVLTVAIAVLGPFALRRRSTGLLCCGLLVGVLVVRLPTPGWPPDGWVVVACDVGQGDALVLDAGGGSAVVVDAGPDPALVDRCLDRLGVERVAEVLLTHIHAPSHNITRGPKLRKCAEVAKAKEAPTTAGIYCRISRDAEGEEIGVARQEKDCRDLAERLGLTVVGVFTDNDIGASDFTRKSKKRPQYEALLDEVRAGRVGHILSYSNSRLTRRLKELEVLVELARDTGVRIRTVVSGGDVDLSTADGLTVARILASVDAGEAHRISERMKVALLHKAQSGEPKVTSNSSGCGLPVSQHAIEHSLRLASNPLVTARSNGIDSAPEAQGTSSESARSMRSARSFAVAVATPNSLAFAVRAPSLDTRVHSSPRSDVDSSSCRTSATATINGSAAPLLP